MKQPVEKLTCVIIEDQQTDREYLESFVINHPLLLLKASFSNAVEANTYIRQHPPQLMFTDIDMPVINGMDFFKQLTSPPICVFITAHSEFAWEGFEANAFDFILKPVKPERFEACISRLREYFELLKRSDVYESMIAQDIIAIKEGAIKHVLNVNDILYIEALKDYSKIVTPAKKIMTLSKLKHFIDKLPAGKFIRIHRSYAVAVNRITRIGLNDLFVLEYKLPIGKTYKNTIKQLI